MAIKITFFGPPYTLPIAAGRCIWFVSHGLPLTLTSHSRRESFPALTLTMSSHTTTDAMRAVQLSASGTVKADIYSLPDDILLLIISYISVKDIITLRKVRSRIDLAFPLIAHCNIVTRRRKSSINSRSYAGSGPTRSSDMSSTKACSSRLLKARAG